MVCLDYCGESQLHTRSEVERLVCDNFSYGYSATRSTYKWRQKYSRENYAQLDSWNSRDFDELVCDCYAADKGYLGRAHRNKIAEQRHLTF